MAFDFGDAANNWFRVSEVASELSLGTGDFTILYRVFPDVVTYGPSAQGTVISRDFTAYESYIYQGTLVGYVGGTGNPPTAIAISTGAWASGGVRRNGTSTQMFKDGSFGTASTNSAAANGTGDLYFGNRPPGTGNTNSMDGGLQDIGIWKGAALTDDECVAFHKGFPAKRIRPQSLVLDIPMIRAGSDRRQSRTVTFGASGPSAKAHNRSYG